MGRLQGKKIIVTGGASGYGKGMAERFVAEGATVAILDINLDGARAVADSIGEKAVAVACDVAQAEQVKNAVTVADQAMNGLDVVINNAGWTYHNSPMLDWDEHAIRKTFDINVMSIYFMAHAVIPLWRERKTAGNIVNIGSTAGISPRAGLTWYNASKGAVNLMSRSMAVELAPEKIRVNCIAPVAGDTPLLPTFMGEDTPEKREKFLATIPIGRFSLPEDIAAAAVYLASDEASLVTGVVLPVDGGRTI